MLEMLQIISQFIMFHSSDHALWEMADQFHYMEIMSALQIQPLHIL